MLLLALQGCMLKPTSSSTMSLGQVTKTKHPVIFSYTAKVGLTCTANSKGYSLFAIGVDETNIDGIVFHPTKLISLWPNLTNQSWKQTTTTTKEQLLLDKMLSGIPLEIGDTVVEGQKVQDKAQLFLMRCKHMVSELAKQEERDRIRNAKVKEEKRLKEERKRKEEAVKRKRQELAEKAARRQVLAVKKQVAFLHSKYGEYTRVKGDTFATLELINNVVRKRTAVPGQRFVLSGSNTKGWYTSSDTHYQIKQKVDKSYIIRHSDYANDWWLPITIETSRTFFPGDTIDTQIECVDYNGISEYKTVLGVTQQAIILKDCTL